MDSDPHGLRGWEGVTRFGSVVSHGPTKPGSPANLLGCYLSTLGRPGWMLVEHGRPQKCYLRTLSPANHDAGGPQNLGLLEYARSPRSRMLVEHAQSFRAQKNRPRCLGEKLETSHTGPFKHVLVLGLSGRPNPTSTKGGDMRLTSRALCDKL